MKKAFYRNIIRFILFLILSLFLFWLVYRGQDWDNLILVLKQDVDYSWIFLAVILGMLSHVSRAFRWQIVTRSIGDKIGFGNSFMAVMIGYFANLAIPRMGEFTRCGIVAKYEKVEYSKLLGTIITERVVDLIMLLLLTLIVFVTQFKQIGIFIDTNDNLGSGLKLLLTSKWVWIIGISGVFIIIIAWFLLVKSQYYSKINNFLKGLKEGILSIKKLDKPISFIFHTVFIWFMYYMMLYVCFWAFPFGKGVAPLVALTVFVISSYGMVAPVQGGIGAWHFMVISSVVLYYSHIADISMIAKSFALLVHGAMTLLYIVVGIICLIFLPIHNRKKNE